MSCPPSYAPAQVMNTLKSLTAPALYEEFPRLRKALWGGHIWADGYYGGIRLTSESYREKAIHPLGSQLGLK